MIVLQHAIEMGGERTLASRQRSTSEGRPVRMVLLTWPMVALLGATVAAGTCLLGDCPLYGRRQAKETLVRDIGAVKSTAFRPDGTMLSSLGFDGSVLIWDMATRTRSAFIPRGIGPAHFIAFSPDNRVLAGANVNAVVSLYDLDRDLARTLDDIPAATVAATCVAFSADGKTLAVGQEDGKITLWNVATGHKRSTLGGHESFVVSLAFAPDGATLASSGNGCLTRIWDVATASERFSFTGRTNTSAALCFSPDSRLLATSDHITPTVRLWNMESGTEHASLKGPAGAVVGVAISPDGTTVAAAGYQGAVTFWDLESLEIRPGKLWHAGVRTIAFAPDGRTLATGGFDGTIKLWDFPVATGG
jgi:WD40 repeat protein